MSTTQTDSGSGGSLKEELKRLLCIDEQELTIVAARAERRRPGVFLLSSFKVVSVGQKCKRCEKMHIILKIDWFMILRVEIFSHFNYN
jgi:hypothetical protein